MLGEQVSDAYLAELREDGVSYLFAGANGDDLSGAMEQLASRFGAKKLLLEGGGRINGAFLKHGLIDEFSTLIFPAVDGVAGNAKHRRLQRLGGRPSRRRAERCG